MHASRDDLKSASVAAATLELKAVASRNSTRDFRPAKSGQKLLHELVTRILADKKDLDITLADV